MAKLSPEQVIERFEDLKSNRLTWEDHWQEIADYFVPRKNTITNRQFPGEKRRERLFETTGVQASRTLASALNGLLTNSTIQWFDLRTGDVELDERPNVNMWLQKTTDQMFRILNRSNFQHAINELYSDLVRFGTAGMAMVEDDDRIIRFIPIFIKELFIAENHKGAVDEVYRPHEMKAKQLVQEFGMDNLPKEIIDAHRKNDTSNFEVITAIYPSSLGTKKSNINKPFMFQKILKIRGKPMELEERGFNEFPFLVPRWMKAPGEIYGRSPAMDALADVKMINKMDEVTIKGAQKTIDPPLQAPDEGFVQPLLTKPGGLNYFRAGINDRIEPIFNDARIDFGFQALSERRQRIRDAFFIDQLQLSQGPQMTATEVLQRTEERTRLLGPMLARQQDELLRPMINRLFSIMLRKNIIKKDEIPDELSGSDIDVEYSSLIARSQKASEGQNLLRWMEMISPIIQFQPSVADTIDADEFVKESARIQNITQKVFKPEEEVQAIRQQRRQAQQQQRQLDQTQQAAQAASQLGRNQNQ